MPQESPIKEMEKTLTTELRCPEGAVTRRAIDGSYRPPPTVASVETKMAHLKAKLASGNPIEGSNGCTCGCHRRRVEAAVKDLEAKLKGGFFHSTEDCFCCLPSFGLLQKEKK